MKKKFKFVIEHAYEGFEEWDEELYRESLPGLKKTIKFLLKNKIIPRMGETLRAELPNTEDTECFIIDRIIWDFGDRTRFEVYHFNDIKL